MSVYRPDKNHLVEHPVLSTALGLGPLAAQSTTLAGGICLSLSFVTVLLFSCLVVLSFRRFIIYRYRLAFIMLITATVTSLLDMGLQTFFFQMRMTLGIYLPLVAVNTLLLVFLEQDILRNTPVGLLRRAGVTAAIVFPVIVSVGFLRELLSQGSLLSKIQVVPQAMPVFATSAGAFFILGCLLALSNSLLKRHVGD